MCGPISDSIDTSSSVATNEAPILSAREKREKTRVFRDPGSALIYVLAFDGKARVLTTEAAGNQLSISYHGPEDIEQAVEDGDLVELTAPSEAEIDPDAVASRTDRLIAAQQDTGFNLGDIVRDNADGQYGKVVGFGRVNDVFNSPNRVLLVELSSNDDGQDIVAVNPATVLLVGRLHS